MTGNLQAKQEARLSFVGSKTDPQNDTNFHQEDLVFRVVSWIAVLCFQLFRLACQTLLEYGHQVYHFPRLARFALRLFNFDNILSF